MFNFFSLDYKDLLKPRFMLIILQILPLTSHTFGKIGKYEENLFDVHEILGFKSRSVLALILA